MLWLESAAYVGPPNQKETSMQGMTAALAVLTAIWQASGSKSLQLQAGQQLWHCGEVVTTADLDDERALWTTRDEELQDYYAGWAKESARLGAKPAHKATLATETELRAADFDSASVLDFTATYCGAQHGQMKRIVRDWMLAQGFDAIVRLNRDPSEVVLARPRSQAAVIGAVAL